MTFKLSADQVALRDALRDFFNDTVTSEYRRARAESTVGSDPQVWTGLTALGLFDLFGDENGAGAVELGVIAGECGRAVVPEGFIDALLAGPFAWHRLFTADQRKLVAVQLGAEFGAQLTSGVIRCGLVAGPGAQMTRLVERQGDSGVRLDGVGGLVMTPAELSCLLVEQAGRFWLVDRRSASEGEVVMTPRRLLDTTMQAGFVELRDAPAVSLGEVPALGPVSRIVRAAEMSGAVGRAVEMTVEHVKTRNQFGAPIGSFQAVQHRLADMHVQAEALRSLVLFAGWAADSAPDQAALAALAACRYGCDVSGDIIEGAIQLHGGIGFTWEYDLHLFLRRVKTIEALWRPGLADHQELIALAGGK
jgi:alkylation response protein AidB-like acyl-CoA dehydrogenase